MNILLLTSIYPIPNVKIIGSTSVCHYFAKEWIKQGHEVVVINTYTVYPRIFHWLSSVFENTIANIFPVSINSIRFPKSFDYEIDGVKIFLVPTYKLFPKSNFSSNSIRKTAKEIAGYLNNNGFKPDIVTSHFIHPNLELIPELKKTFPNIPCGINLHGKVFSSKRVREIDSAKELIDFWGFRSFPIGRSFEKNCFIPGKSLYCFSGVPESYIQSLSYEKHKKRGVYSFLFVGNLNKRKHPLAVLDALEKSKLDYSLSFIGTGKQSEFISQRIISEGLYPKVCLLGRLSRKEVSRKMFETECFIMISEDETFGLVYLEAMANGCIVVASRDEGMDGIIENGINGFLCKAGDKDDLCKTINVINNLSPIEKETIARNAIATASNMTDSKVARNYLDALYRIAANK